MDSETDSETHQKNRLKKALGDQEGVIVFEIEFE